MNSSDKKTLQRLANNVRMGIIEGVYNAGCGHPGGSLSATEAFAADVIYLLEKPTITQLAETLGISQPNATYKVNNLSAKGYVQKTTSEDDRRECHLHVSERFHSYYDTSDAFIREAVAKLGEEYSAEELALFEKMLRSLGNAVD